MEKEKVCKLDEEQIQRRINDIELLQRVSNDLVSGVVAPLTAEIERLKERIRVKDKALSRAIGFAQASESRRALVHDVFLQHVRDAREE